MVKSLVAALMLLAGNDKMVEPKVAYLGVQSISCASYKGEFNQGGLIGNVPQKPVVLCKLEEHVGVDCIRFPDGVKSKPDAKVHGDFVIDPASGDVVIQGKSEKEDLTLRIVCDSIRGCYKLQYWNAKLEGTQCSIEKYVPPPEKKVEPKDPNETMSI